MTYFFVNLNGYPQVGPLPLDQPVSYVAASYGVEDPALYAEFTYEDFDAACYLYPGAFSLANGIVSFSLDVAKSIADSIVNNQSNEQAKANLSGLSYDVYMAQCALPADQRVAKYQAAIDANNALAIETENREQAVYAAETIEEVNAIVYPPAAS